MTIRLFVSSMAVIVALFASRAVAQCGQWLPVPGYARVDSISQVTWDPDGLGPREELLVVYGDIELGHPIDAHRLRRSMGSDGSTWVRISALARLLVAALG